MFGQLLGWTARAWENPSQEIHRMKEVNYPYCLCQEHKGNIADVTGKWQNETCGACMPMNELDQPTVAALGFKRNERLTAMLELVNLFSSTSRHPSECLIWTHSCQFLVFGRDPNHLLLRPGMHLRHMNIRPGCNVTVVTVVMTNCTHLSDLFARIGVLAVEHIAVGLGDSLVCK